MLRIVIDTNLVLSAFLWGGVPAKVFDTILDDRAILVSSEYLVEELRTTLSRRKFEKKFKAANLTPEHVVNRYLQYAEMVEPVELANSVIRDPKDVPLLACAVGGEADFLISGDNDLLVLESFQSIPIIRASAFLDLLNTSGDDL